MVFPIPSIAPVGRSPASPRTFATSLLNLLITSSIPSAFNAISFGVAPDPRALIVLTNSFDGASPNISGKS